MNGRAVVAMVGATVTLALLGGCSATETDACRAFVPDEHHLSLFALDAASGRVRWEHTDLPLYANGYTHISGPLVVVSRGVTGETFDLRSGEGGPPPPSTVPTGTIAVNRPGATLPPDLRPAAVWDAPAVAGDDGVGFDSTSTNGALIGFDPDTGERRWTFALDRPTHSHLHLHDGIVVVSTGDAPPGGCP